MIQNRGYLVELKYSPTRKGKSAHFSAFAKYTKRDINSIEILVLFIILVVVGALSGWFGNLLWAAWHPSINEASSQTTSCSIGATTSPPASSVKNISKGASNEAE